MLSAQAPQNHKLNFKCKISKTVLAVFLKALWKLMRAILSRRRITRLVRLPTDTTTARAISIEMSWLCVAMESQSSRDLLQRRSSIELGSPVRGISRPDAAHRAITELRSSLIQDISMLNILPSLRMGTSGMGVSRAVQVNTLCSSDPQATPHVFSGFHRTLQPELPCMRAACPVHATACSGGHSAHLTTDALCISCG